MSTPVVTEFVKASPSGWFDANLLRGVAGNIAVTGVSRAGDEITLRYRDDANAEQTLTFDVGSLSEANRQILSRVLPGAEQSSDLLIDRLAMWESTQEIAFAFFEDQPGTIEIEDATYITFHTLAGVQDWAVLRVADGLDIRNNRFVLTQGSNLYYLRGGEFTPIHRLGTNNYYWINFASIAGATFTGERLTSSGPTTAYRGDTLASRSQVDASGFGRNLRATDRDAQTIFSRIDAAIFGDINVIDNEAGLPAASVDTLHRSYYSVATNTLYIGGVTFHSSGNPAGDWENGPIRDEFQIVRVLSDPSRTPLDYFEYNSYSRVFYETVLIGADNEWRQVVAEAALADSRSVDTYAVAYLGEHNDDGEAIANLRSIDLNTDYFYIRPGEALLRRLILATYVAPTEVVDHYIWLSINHEVIANPGANEGPLLDTVRIDGRDYRLIHAGNWMTGHSYQQGMIVRHAFVFWIRNDEDGGSGGTPAYNNFEHWVPIRPSDFRGLHSNAAAYGTGEIVIDTDLAVYLRTGGHTSNGLLSAIGWTRLTGIGVGTAIGLRDEVQVAQGGTLGANHARPQEGNIYKAESRGAQILHIETSMHPGATDHTYRHIIYRATFDGTSYTLGEVLYETPLAETYAAPDEFLVQYVRQFDNPVTIAPDEYFAVVQVRTDGANDVDGGAIDTVDIEATSSFSLVDNFPDVAWVSQLRIQNTQALPNSLHTAITTQAYRQRITYNIPVLGAHIQETSGGDVVANPEEPGIQPDLETVSIRGTTYQIPAGADDGRGVGRDKTVLAAYEDMGFADTLEEGEFIARDFSRVPLDSSVLEVSFRLRLTPETVEVPVTIPAGATATIRVGASEGQVTLTGSGIDDDDQRIGLIIVIDGADFYLLRDGTNTYTFNPPVLDVVDATIESARYVPLYHYGLTEEIEGDEWLALREMPTDWGLLSARQRGIGSVANTISVRTGASARDLTEIGHDNVYLSRHTDTRMGIAVSRWPNYFPNADPPTNGRFAIAIQIREILAGGGGGGRQQIAGVNRLNIIDSPLQLLRTTRLINLNIVPRLSLRHAGLHKADILTLNLQVSMGPYTFPVSLSGAQLDDTGYIDRFDYTWTDNQVVPCILILGGSTFRLSNTPEVIVRPTNALLRDRIDQQFSILVFVSEDFNDPDLLAGLEILAGGSDEALVQLRVASYDHGGPV